MAPPDLTLSTPLGQDTTAAPPGSPPPPETQATPAPEPEAPKDLASWYGGEISKLLPRFDAANKAAQESIASQQKQLGEYKTRALGAPGLPESPELPETPQAPKITARPFLAGMPGEDPIQSLNKLMAGFGLMAEMAAGIKGGFPQGALSAYQGALEGWHQGDQVHAANQLQTFMGQLKQHDRDVNAIRTKYEDAVRKWSGDQDRLKTELGILAAEHGLGREGIELAFKDPERALSMTNQTAKLLSDMQTSAATLGMKNAQWYADRIMKLQDFERQQQRDAETVRHNKATEATAVDKLEAAQAKTEKLSGPVAERLGALQEAMTSRDQINALRGNPNSMKELNAWLGPVAAQQRLGSWIPGGGFQPPDNVVKLDQALANLRNTALKARSGAAVTEPEQRRFDQEFPKVTDQPDVFWRKYAAIERNLLQNAETFRSTAAPHVPASIVQPNAPLSGGGPSKGWGKAEVVR